MMVAREFLLCLSLHLLEVGLFRGQLVHLFFLVLANTVLLLLRVGLRLLPLLCLVEVFFGEFILVLPLILLLVDSV